MPKLLPLLLLSLALAVAACSSQKPVTNPAYYLGEIHLRRGELNEAVDAYKVFILDPGHNPDLYLPRAYYMLAFAYYRQGRYDESLATLDQLEQRYPQLESVQVWTLRGDVSRALGYRVQALQEYDEAWRFAKQMDRVRLESRFNGTLKEMSVDELTQAEGLISDPALHQSTVDQLVAAGGSVIAAEDQAAADDTLAAEAAAGEPSPILRTEERRDKRAEEAARRERVRGVAPAPVPLEDAVVEEPEPVLAEAPPPEPAPEEIPPVDIPVPGPAKVACIAPLSGRGSAIGQQVCDSVRGAFGDTSDRVIAQDAGETTNAARAAWMTVAEDANVVAVVAWLPPESTQAVAAMAEANGLATIVLSGTAPSAPAPYVHAWGPSRSQEVSSLADYMISTVRIARFGVLYPDTTSGNDYLDRMSQAVRLAGGSIVAKQFYRSGTLNWGPEVETLKKWRKRDVNVEAVFIPDDLGNVADLVTDINRRWPDVIVLGLSSWSGTTAPLRAFIASSSDNGASGAGSALYGAIIGGGANSRGSVESRLRNVDTATAASSGAPAILRIQGGSAERVGG